jgi:hypothetical protein
MTSIAKKIRWNFKINAVSPVISILFGMKKGECGDNANIPHFFTVSTLLEEPIWLLFF